MGEKFELLDHTADTGIIAWGDTLEEAFENTARGMFSIITSLEDVQQIETHTTRVESSDRENLLVDWLNDLIYLFDVKNLLFSSFEITSMDQTSLTTLIKGQKVDFSKHELKTGIKAATFHMLKIEREKERKYRIQVLFDI
ncbi:MAG: archease [Dehalococcoidales bacterium]|nr:archease [Dehalococcoidales bacterium]